MCYQCIVKYKLAMVDVAQDEVKCYIFHLKTTLCAISLTQVCARYKCAKLFFKTQLPMSSQ